jgi:hypothetical protein
VDGWTTCTASWEDVSGAFYGSWSTANSGIATVDYYANHTGVAIGSTTSATFGYMEHNSSRNSTCPITKFVPLGGTDNVRVLYAARLVQPLFSQQNSCVSGQAGWDRGILEVIVDQSGQPWTYNGITMSELITIGRNDLGLSCIDPVTKKDRCKGTEQTYGAGNFDDRFSFCSPVCTNPTNGETDSTQVLYYNGVPVQVANTLVYKCASITWNGQ